jgi:UDP-glucose 4-epimerase
MKVFLTGATSLSGFWIHQSLLKSSQKVWISMTRGCFSDYETDKACQRVELLKADSNPIFKCAFGSDAFIDFIKNNELDFLCLHGAYMPDYRSPNFNIQKALDVNLFRAEAVFDLLKGSKTQVVYTGTVFEPNEGESGKPSPAVSPYGTAKALISQQIENLCKEREIVFKKFVIPNPFGPLEDKKFTRFVMETWKSGKPAEVKFPQYVRDNIHVKTLALAYCDFLNSPKLSIRPSQIQGSQKDFCFKLQKEVRERTSWACDLDILKQTEFAEPFSRINSDSTADFEKVYPQKQAWDEYVEFYKNLIN